MTLYKLCAVQAQTVQENGKKPPRAGCNIQLIKMVKDILVPNICHIKIMIHSRKFTAVNISR